MTGKRAAKPVRRPDPPPLDIDESRIIAVGIAAWSVAFVVLICMHSRLSREHHSWYPWTAVAGIGLGFWGWYLVRKRIAARHAGSSQSP